MTLIAYALLAFNLSILLTVQVAGSQHVPQTCECPQVKKMVRGPFLDFKVTLKGPSCPQDEIIVTPQKTNRPVCLSPRGGQGKRLMKCWNSMKRAGKDTKQCLRQKRKPPRQGKRKQNKSKKVTS